MRYKKGVQALFDFEEQMREKQNVCEFPMDSFPHVNRCFNEFVDNPTNVNRRFLALAVAVLSAKVSAWDLEETIKEISEERIS